MRKAPFIKKLPGTSPDNLFDASIASRGSLHAVGVFLPLFPIEQPSPVGVTRLDRGVTPSNSTRSPIRMKFRNHWAFSVDILVQPWPTTDSSWTQRSRHRELCRNLRRPCEGKKQRAKETAPGFIESQALRRSISYLC